MPLRKPLPQAFLDRMSETLGDEMPAFEQALQQDPPISVRYRPEFAPAPNAEQKPVPWCQHAHYLNQRPDFFKDPKIFGGAYYVQEASSMFLDTALEHFIDFSQPLKILDLCAAPGGKSTLVSSRMRDGHLLVANELVGKRLAALEDNLMRWGRANYLVAHNSPKHFAPLHGFFDIILIDAPCSGEGMFRKDPGAVDYWSENLVKSCAVRQWEILSDIMPSLKPGGLLIYSTCTYSHDENEGILEKLAATEHFSPLPLELPPDWGIREGFVEHGGKSFTGYRFYPHKVAGEGFFMTFLQKKWEAMPANKPKKLKQKRGRLQPLPKKFIDHVAQWLKNHENFALYLIDDQLYALPKAFKSEVLQLSDLLNLRNAGLLLGKFKAPKLIPSHELALSEHLPDSVNRLPLDYGQAIAYLKKQEFILHRDVPKGWAVVTFDKVALGWAKVIPGRINNYYPKSQRLRKNFDFGADGGYQLVETG